ncbi:polysaccharide deacetylase family protein [Hymenobacter coalescens]
MAALTYSLPPLQASPVSVEARLAYVLKHFRLAYEVADLPAIGYADAQPAIAVAAGADRFFEQTAPYPPEPSLREWRGRRLPFFFDPNPAGPLLTLSPGRADIHADVLAAAFFLLSGWQEYYSEERDQHGRFPFTASVQHRYGFVTVPVVNYYFDVLRTAVEHVTSRPLRPRQWAAGAPFATFVTHDIDNLQSAWKAPAKAALQQRNWLGFGKHLWHHLTRPDAWDNLAQVRAAVASHGAVSTFFLLPNHRPGLGGTPNADYRFRAVWPRIAAAIGDAEVGLHGSLGTARHGGHLKRDWQRIPVPVEGLRFHYLSWEPRLTPTLVSMHSFTHDSTLGFAEHFGFRHSYCLPFYPYDLAQQRIVSSKRYSLPGQLEPGSGPEEPHPDQACRFLEIPLNLMDATLHHPHYLQLAPDEILPAIEPMLREIERFGGVFTMLWHNENFDAANTANGPREFHRIMEYLRGRGTAFLTGRQICEMVT